MVAEQIIAHLKRSLAVRQRAAAAGAWAAPQAAWLALPWALEQYGADHWGWSMDLGKINVEVKRQRLIVTLEGTSYRAVFRLSPDKSRLIESGALAVDKSAPMAHRDFEALAWEAANAKARALGWIS